MKFKIAVTDLQYALRTVRDVVPTTGPMAETTGVLIEVTSGKAVFTAVNPQIMAKATVTVDSETNGIAVVDVVDLYNAVSHFKPLNDRGVGTEDILVAVSTKTKKLQISTKTRYVNGHAIPHKRVFALRNHEFFPQVPEVGDNSSTVFKMSAEVLLDGVQSISYALAKDESQYIFTGVLMQLSKGKMTLFATNGICLAEYKAPIDYSGPAKRIIVPGSFASKLAKSFFDTDGLVISLSESLIFVSSSSLVLGGALIREEFPDYESVIPKPNVSLSLNKQMIIDNLVNLTYESARVDDSRVSCSVSGGYLSLVCGQSLNGDIPVSDETNNCYSGEVNFDCNLNLLVSSIKGLFGDTLTVGISDKSQPLLFSSDNNNHTGASLTSVLVPLSS